MAVALRNHPRAVNFFHATALLQIGLKRAEPHGAAHIALNAALLQRIAIGPFGHQPDQFCAGAAKLAGDGVTNSGHIPRRFQHRHLHAVANAEIRHIARAGKIGRGNLAFRAALAKAAGHENAIYFFKIRGGVFALKYLAVHPFNIHADIIGNPAMLQAFNQRFIGVFQLGIFPDNGNVYLAFRLAHGGHDLVPNAQIGRRSILNAKRTQHFHIQPFSVIGMRHGVNAIDVLRLNHRAFAHITKQADFPFFAFRNRPVAATQQNIRLNTDGAQFLHRMLRRLGFHLARSGDIGQ